MAHIELDMDERRQFYKLLNCKLKMIEIAEIMRRHKSTLYRELKRNFWHDQEVPKAAGYFPVTAQDMATDRRARQRKLIRFPKLLDEVIDRLDTGWSPEQIAGRLKVEPNAPHNISHETIYQFVYSKEGQKRELGKLLPLRQKKRKPLYARKARGNVFPDTVSIKNRPDNVNDAKNSVIGRRI
jgi:IS30 family transposase